MTKPFVLLLLDFKKEFVIEINASRVGIGVVLIHEGHHLTYISKFLGQIQQALSTL
jgi:hypothetical protein